MENLIPITVREAVDLLWEYNKDKYIRDYRTINSLLDWNVFEGPPKGKWYVMPHGVHIQDLANHWDEVCLCTFLNKDHEKYQWDGKYEPGYHVKLILKDRIRKTLNL